MDVIRKIGVVVFVLTAALGAASAQGPATPDGTDPERVELPGDAGEALLWPGGDRAVLLAHGAAYDAVSWTDQAVVLHAEGYTVLAVENISADTIATAIAWLMDEREASGVVVIGASAGGGGTLSALAEQPEGVVGLVLMGATGPVDSLGNYPKLFTASEGEGMRDRLESMAAEAAGDENRIEIIPGDAHAQATFNEEEGETLLDAIILFLNDDAGWSDDEATPMA